MTLPTGYPCPIKRGAASGSRLVQTQVKMLLTCRWQEHRQDIQRVVGGRKPWGRRDEGGGDQENGDGEVGRHKATPDRKRRRRSP